MHVCVCVYVCVHVRVLMHACMHVLAHIFLQTGTNCGQGTLITSVQLMLFILAVSLLLELIAADYSV